MVVRAAARSTARPPMPFAAADNSLNFDSPLAIGVLATIALLLVVVLARELRNVPKSLLVLMAAAFLEIGRAHV